MVVLCLAFVVRAATFALNSPFSPPAKDDAVYDALGWNLVNGHGFSASAGPPYEPLVFRTPGYPAFLAGIYAIAGHSPNAVRWTQIVLSVLTCFLLYALAARLMRPGAALLAAALYAISPAAAWFTSLLLTESNQAFLLVLAIYLVCVCASAKRWYLYVGLGVVLAVAALSRPDYELLAVPLLAVLWLSAGFSRAVALRIGAAFVCFCALLVPWMWRNEARFGEFTLATGTGHTLIAAKLEAEGKTGPALYQALDQKYGRAFQEKYARPMTYVDGTLPDQDKLRLQEFKSFVRSEPVTYAQQSIKRVAKLWYPRSWSEAAGFAADSSVYRSKQQRLPLVGKAVLLVWDSLLLLVAAFGFALGLKDWKRFAPVLVSLAYFSAVYGLVYSGPRYRVPLMPLVVLLTSYGLAQAYSWLAVRRGWNALTTDDMRALPRADRTSSSPGSVIS
jgi:4-amino-4-deoxy-L-arabinose transferase-like glycosyltransferase